MSSDKPNSDIIKFQRDCFSNYLTDIQQNVEGFPDPYLFPDGNPIQPVIPVITSINKIMIIGAFPSARFERREGRLIPVANNLAPFGAEHYFDGHQVRVQESTESLYNNYLLPLGFKREEVGSNFWITDIVKVYLYPPKHIKNCVALFPGKSFVNTHQMFKIIAFASRDWFLKEISVCNPKLVIILGEVAARVVSNDKGSPVSALLNGVIHKSNELDNRNVVHLAHPEIRRINQSWDKLTEQQLIILAKEIKDYI